MMGTLAGIGGTVLGAWFLNKMRERYGDPHPGQYKGPPRPAEPLPEPPPATEPVEDEQEAARRAADRARKRARSARAGTVLTSPLGVVETAPVRRKTLLGE